MMTIVRTAAPLREQIVDAIRHEIVNGTFGPRMRLKEKDLVDRFGVSRTVVREALRQMESERLVRIEPNVGPVVEDLTVDVARELYEVREALEGAVMQLAAERRQNADVQQLTDMMRELEQAVRDGVGDMSAIKDRFYRLVVGIARNRSIGEMLGNVQTRISQLRRITLSHPGRGTEMLTEIQEMVDAIEAGDGLRALEAARAHVRKARTIALDHLNGGAGESGSGQLQAQAKGGA